MALNLSSAFAPTTPNCTAAFAATRVLNYRESPKRLTNKIAQCHMRNGTAYYVFMRSKDRYDKCMAVQ